jgi:hypothetical protein
MSRAMFGYQTNCSPSNSPRLHTSLKILLSRILSKKLPVVSSRLIGCYDEGRDGSFLGFKLEITRAWFHTLRKYCARSSALNTATMRHIARCGRCFGALFGKPLGPGALPTLKPRIASWTSWGWLTQARLQGHKSMIATPRQRSQ